MCVYKNLPSYMQVYIIVCLPVGRRMCKPMDLAEVFPFFLWIVYKRCISRNVHNRFSLPYTYVDGMALLAYMFFGTTPRYFITLTCNIKLPK